MSTWNLEKMYVKESLVEKDIDIVNQLLKELKLIKATPLENMKAIMIIMEEVFRKVGKLSSYAHMKKDEDSRISKNQKLSLQIDNLTSEASSKFSFFKPFLYEIDENELNKILLSEDFRDYKGYLERMLRYKNHTLTKKEENILSKFESISQNSYNDFYNLSYADLKFPSLENTEIPLNHANYTKLLMDSDRKVRKEAFEKMYTVYGNYNNTFGSTLYGALKYNHIVSELRNFKSTMEMSLFDDEISTKVYDGLIASIHDHLPSFQKYYRSRNKRLGLEKGHMYDVYAPVIDNMDEIPYEEAQKIILEALKPMGDEYLEIIRKAFDENWIDVYPREGKRAGAYSGGCYDSDPYILLNYTGTIDSVFTLAHELGHSAHSYLSRKNNHYFNSSYRIFVAEVASTFNELLLLQYLKENSKKDKERLYFLDHHLNSFKSTVFRQTMFAEFEKEIYKKTESNEGMTGDDFSDIYYGLNKLYFGDSIVLDKEISLEWERVPHFYYGYYVYKYATGFCAATILSQRVLDKEAGARDQYIEFLKDGGNHPPLEQLRLAGCDIEDPKTLEIALNLFDTMVDEYNL